jgi:hypothetical protein
MAELSRLVDKNASPNHPNFKATPKSSWCEDFGMWNGKVLFAVQACTKCA